MNTRQRLLSTIAGSLILGAAAMSAHAQTVYNVAGLADFTGPFADIMKDMTGCRRAVLDWWNDDVGKAQGVALRIKDYDTRYDTAQVASLWPGIKSELNPIVALGVGGPDAAALQQRLPNDKVPLVLANAGYGFAWKEGSWVFNTRPTYAHEAAAFYTWLQKKSGGAGPIKLGLISSEVSPAFVDIHKGVEKFAKDNPQVLVVVETIYTVAQPTDLTQEVNRLLRKGATVLQVFNNTATVVATRRALESLGRPEVPIVMSAHNGLLSSGKALGALKQLEGSYEVYGLAVPTADATLAHAFFDKLSKQYKLQATFNGACVMGMSQALVAARAVEQVVKEKGAAGVTGADVRTAIVSMPLTTERTFGVMPGIRYSNDAPFPTQGLAVNIATVQSGQYKLLAPDVPVPEVKKW